MPTIGLIGYPLAHSFSPGYFKNIFEKNHLSDWEYKLFPLERIEDIKEVFKREQELVAFNVTVPYKQAILPFCAHLHDDVKAIGACNLVLRSYKQGDTWMGYNTDHYGFASSLQDWYSGKKQKALVLGSGGSSKAVQYALQSMGIAFDVAGRTLAKNYHTTNLSDYDLIVNCSPVGMQGYANESNILPLQYETIQEGSFFYDLVYNPENTAMMQEFSKRGAEVKNGLEMLHKQADRAWEIIQEKV